MPRARSAALTRRRTSSSSPRPGFAYDSYSVKALEYLLKPIRAKTLYPIADRLGCVSAARRKRRLRFAPAASSCACRFRSSPMWRSTASTFTSTFADGQVREVVGSMKEYEDALLTAAGIMRIHRSTSSICCRCRGAFAHRAPHLSGRELPVSRLLYPPAQRTI